MLAVPLLLVARCQGSGDIDLRDAAQEPVSDTVDDAVDDAPVSDTVEDGTPDCEPERTAAGPDGHRTGEDCLGCHASMSGSRRWTVAGTLYSDASGSAAVSGATITVTDAGGATLRLVTHPNGNFYTTEAVELPLSMKASLCPDSAEMLSQATSGSCNSCHDASFRVHLP